MLYEIDSQLDFEHQYLKKAITTASFGIESGNRTGINTLRTQGCTIDLHCHYSFPIMRGKQIGFKTAFVEFMWILLGRTDLKFLKDNGVNYWDSWVNKETGEFGKIYGHQMRYFDNQNKFDQLLYVINELRTNPDSRRALISLWNGSDLNEQSLACCHFLYHFTSFEHNGVRYLDLHVNQRSADIFLGVPYDFLLFSFMLHFMSIMAGYKPRIVHCTFNDWHLYKNHLHQIKVHNDNYLTVVGEKTTGEYKNLADIKKPETLPQIEYNYPLISSFDFLNEDNLKREITQKELASETGLAKNTITVMLEKMEKNNLINRITDENDKRKSLVILTDYAKSLKRPFDEISEEMLKRVYKGFSEEEIDKYEEYLHRIIKNLEEKREGEK